MSVWVDPPVTYCRRDGTRGCTDAPVGDWPYPMVWWEADVRVEKRWPSSDWIDLGWAPTPRTRWRWLVYDVCHGLLMRYPLRHVLTWSLQASGQWRQRSGT